jgi:hypothetical protein
MAKNVSRFPIFSDLQRVENGPFSAPPREKARLNFRRSGCSRCAPPDLMRPRPILLNARRAGLNSLRAAESTSTRLPPETNGQSLSGAPKTVSFQARFRSNDSADELLINTHTERPYMSLILPAFNESALIARTISKATQCFHGRRWSFKIIVAADGTERNARSRRRTRKDQPGDQDDWSCRTDGKREGHPGSSLNLRGSFHHCLRRRRL